ncbi:MULTISPECIES: hypothetical protein [Legionella]|nr:MULTISPECIES: hypothetical protein [Legionella]
MMKKLVLIMALFSLNAFAADEVNPNSYANNNCERIKDPAERKDCLDIEKNNQAQENFRNFEENSPESYQGTF